MTPFEVIANSLAALGPQGILDDAVQILNGAAGTLPLEVQTAEAAFDLVKDVIPPLAIGFDSLKLLILFLMLLQKHTSNKPGLSVLPGPSLEVPYPAKF